MAQLFLRSIEVGNLFYADYTIAEVARRARMYER